MDPQHRLSVSKQSICVVQLPTIGQRLRVAPVKTSSMANRISDIFASHFTSPASRLNLCLFAGVASLGTLILLRSTSGSLESDRPEIIPSPAQTILPCLSGEEKRALPYPPDALRGARDVDSPYGSVRLYEFGPEQGEKVLLIHGISTPSIALAGLAHQLVERGYRVMLFGR